MIPEPVSFLSRSAAGPLARCVVESRNGGEGLPGPVIYWMSRDQRAADNPALLCAQHLALEARRPLGVVFCLDPKFPGATWRAYDFLIQGLSAVRRDLAAKGIPFLLLDGEPDRTLPAFCERWGVCTVVTDYDPLRVKTAWRAGVRDRSKAAFIVVDAHNVVPVHLASAKKEVGARTLRPKIARLLPEFLVEFPELKGHPHPWVILPDAPEPLEVLRRLSVDRGAGPISRLAPGEAAAVASLRSFLRERLPRYAASAADPNAGAVSGLSPYLHFGQISPRRVALAVRAAQTPAESKDRFLEELIVRRELSDNFCRFEPDYDSLACAPAWAKTTLDAHRDDQRPYVYDLAALENARTHDPLWNAAQVELVRRGGMHGYLRMYWAKKILEWSPTPEEAFSLALDLNDRYQLDGRDPNGYAGVAWSVAGVHDRPWPERPVFGKIRCMTLAGCRSKFDVDAFIRSAVAP